MRKRIQDLTHVMDQLRPRLEEYLSLELGEKFKKGRNFSCINPSHKDSNPSCGIVPGNPQLFHCFGCGAAGDIFKAAHLIHQYPADGPEFISKTVLYLADKFHIPYEMPELSEDELYEQRVYRAYQEASIIITNYPSESTKKFIRDRYKWSEQTVNSLRIGSVETFDSYFERMQQAGFDKNFLREVDLDNRKLFSPNNLIYTICDDYGRPVGFAARNLLYEQAIAVYQAARDLAGDHTPQAQEAKAKVPPKYYNSMEHTGTQTKNRIYKKGSRLFGFHLAKKACSPLYVFEGYADCATAQDRGLKNCCAIGSTSFTEDHFDLLLAYSEKIRHIVFVLDADKAGQEGTKRFVERAEKKFSCHVGMQVDIICMPEGSDDPDTMIRAPGKGLEAFKKLPLVSLFTWKMTQFVDQDQDPITVAEQMARIIVNEPMPLRRYKLCCEASERLKIPVDFLHDQVKTLTDENRARLEEQRVAIANNLAQQLRKNPDKVSHIIEKGLSDLKVLGSEMGGYNPNGVIEVIRQSRRDARNKQAYSRLLTGWPLFDSKFGGFPTKSAFISVPGAPNSGKTSWLVNCCWRILDNNKNKDVRCFYHTMDDALDVFIPRLLASKVKLPSKYFRETATYEVNINSDERILKAVEEAEEWLDQMITQQRLIIADTAMLPRDLGAFGVWLRDLRKQFPASHLIGFADNFHHYDIRSGGPSEGEAKVAYIARYAKDLAIKYATTLVMTMELGKRDLAPGVRPKLSSLKGSAAISYESSANIGIYNDMKSVGEFRSNLFWNSGEMEEFISPKGHYEKRSKRKPVIELVFDKSKINDGFDGVIYYQMDPESGRYEEESETRQREMAEHAYHSADHSNGPPQFVSGNSIPAGNRPQGKNNYRNTGISSPPTAPPKMAVNPQPKKPAYAAKAAVAMSEDIQQNGGNATNTTPKETTTA